jgi:hypothetical protein
MPTLDEEDLKALLGEPRLGMVERTYRNPGFRHVLVWRLLSMAEAKYGSRPNLEQDLDSVVERVGGERIAMVDPWRWLPDVLRRLRGSPLPPREDIYAVPAGFVEK